MQILTKVEEFISLVPNNKMEGVNLEKWLLECAGGIFLTSLALRRAEYIVLLQS